MYHSLVGKSERKKPLERNRCRWEDNIKIVLREIGRGVRGSGWGLLSGTCEQDNGGVKFYKSMEFAYHLSSC
jgi:hypothetical protein